MSNSNQRLSRFLHNNNINVALDHIIDFLKSEGLENLNRNSKIDFDIQQKLLLKFKSETKEQLIIKHKEDLDEEQNEPSVKDEGQKKSVSENELNHKQELKETKETKETKEELKTSDPKNNKEQDDEKQKEKKEENKSNEGGIKILGKIDLKTKKKRKRIRINIDERNNKQKNKKDDNKKELGKEDQDEINKKIKENLSRLLSSEKKKSVKLRRQKRAEKKQQREEELIQDELEQKTLKVSEFTTVNELSSLMSIDANSIIGACMQLGLMVTMNQRLDAETISILAEEFNFTVQFTDPQEEESEEEEVVDQNEPRHPIVTVMGHVDHGKTSFLDYIRNTNVIAGESGGITQHIGAYEVTLSNKRKITFLDTPGHEAFTAMRARGAKLTDVVVIIIAADDKVMPQTKEAISHAKAANVPIIFGINKIDKENADAEKIKEQLANENMLVEDWGGKYQSQDISSKTGKGINELLDKVLLESDILELKCNSKVAAKGTVIEASLDKGKGYLSTVLVQNGTLRIGDVVLAGPYWGKIKALLNERGNNLNDAGPAIPAVILGLNGAPQAGDTLKVIKDEKEAKKTAAQRSQIQREQQIRTSKHITLDEIGRRIALGEFKELNLILKADVDGSIEVLADSLQKLGTEKIHINILHKSIGQITESDVMLASASDAIIIGFQVRPSLSARKLAEKEEIDIRTYSIIYNVIEELEQAIAGMLSPETEEKIVCNIEIREVYKISRIGKVAGCYVLDGKVKRNTSIRLLRDGVVIFTGSLSSLKRFKEDAKEVVSGYECGLTIENYNDIKVGDIIEGFEEVEVKTK